MAEIVDKAALGTLAEDDELAIVQVGTTYRIQFSNLKAGIAGLDLQTLALGGTGKDMSALGGSSNYVTQSSVGATLTAKAIVPADLPNASDVAVGIIELATQAEVDTGTDVTKAVTPATLQGTISNLAIVGEIRAWPRTVAPSDWILCKGAAISRTTYSALFAVIGVTFGVGDGSTTFNLPDYQGAFPIGVSGTYALAATGGEATHELSAAEMPAHTHVVDNLTANNVGVAAGANTTYSAVATGTMGNTGSGTAHENLHPYIALNYIMYTGT